ncbi:HEAT repeat domain-containing protein [candidate division KSB1 bacterium]|nr:HEAT repeat domain-containing protein [candidate division KSB1 bacterium]
MGFYDLSKTERKKLVEKINQTIKNDLCANQTREIKEFAADADTYIRRNVYLETGKLYHNEPEFRDRILSLIRTLYQSKNEKIRQTAVYAWGEIGKHYAETILGDLEQALYDTHHSVRNAVTGALKQMSEKNPQPTLAFAQKFFNHPNPEVRREIIHGIELRGRAHPEDILPLLSRVQQDPHKRVQEILVHVLAQISYKKGCLEKVLSHLQHWDNQPLIHKALKEIIQVHHQYAKFSEKSASEARDCIRQHFPDFQSA